MDDFLSKNLLVTGVFAAVLGSMAIETGRFRTFGLGLDGGFYVLGAGAVAVLTTDILHLRRFPFTGENVQVPQA